MSGSLSHSPADIIRYLLIDLDQGTLPTSNNDWPIYVSNEPDSPDNCITVYDTTGIMQGRSMLDGSYSERHGAQIRIRANKHPVGYLKARQIAVALDTNVSLTTVTIGTSTYLVWVVSRTGDVNVIGKDAPTTKRSLFTLNILATIVQSA